MYEAEIFQIGHDIADRRRRKIEHLRQRARPDRLTICDITLYQRFQQCLGSIIHIEFSATLIKPDIRMPTQQSQARVCGLSQPYNQLYYFIKAYQLHPIRLQFIMHFKTIALIGRYQDSGLDAPLRELAASMTAAGRTVLVEAET